MNLQDFRQKIPQLNGLSDSDALDVLQKNFYPTVDKQRMADVLGVSLASPEAQSPKGRTAKQTMSDLGITALKGAIGLTEVPVGIADILTGGAAGKKAEGLGYRPEEAKAILDAAYSDPQKKAFANVQQAGGFMGKLFAAAENPSVIAHTVGESLPSMLAGGVAARGLMGIGGAAVKSAAGGVGPALPGVMARTFGQSAPLVAGAAGEGLVGAGSAAEQIRQQTADGYLTGDQSGLAAASGVATSLFGVLGGKVAQRLGIGDVDTMLAGAARDPVMRKGVVRSFLDGTVTEGALEELPQSISEQVLQNMALGKPLDEGVDHAAALGLLSGGVMGGGAGGLGAIGNKAQAAADAKTQAAAAAQAEADAAAAAIRANKQPGSGPLTNAVNAVTEADAQRVEVAGASAAAAIASAPEGSAEFINPDFQARQQTLAEQMANPENREKVRARFGDDGLNQVLYYAQAAGRADIPAKTADNMLQVAERMMGDVLLQPLGGDAQLGGMVRDPLTLDAPEVAGAQPLGLGLDQTPSGRFTVDGQGNAMPETAVQRGDAQRRAGEISSLGSQKTDILNPSGQPFKTKLAASLAAKKTPGEVVEAPGGYAVRAEQTTPATKKQQEQPPAQQPILNNGKPFTLAEVGKANQAIGGTAVSVPGGWAIQPPATAQQPAATPATAMPPAATPAASSQSAILGRNSQPIAEGGQPFATREEAKAEKRMQPLMRVAPAEGGGFILKPASERQLAAVEKAAKRLKYPSTGETGPRSLHGFILQIGGLASGAMPDVGFDLNPRVGNRRLFSPRGKTIEQAAMAAKQEGYIQDEDENTLIEALKRSLNVSPVYTPDGYEAMAEAQMQARYEDFLAAEQDGGAENDWSRLTPEELADTGYNDYDEATQAEIRALVAQAEALGIDAESILEDVAQRTENATQKDYENAAKSAIEAAIRSSEESRSRDLGQASAEAGPATADTQADPAAVTGPASDVRARNLAALKARMMGQKKPTPTTPPAPNQQATPAPEAGPTKQGATNGQGQETLLKAGQPTGAAAMVSGAPVAENPSDTTKPGGFIEKAKKAAGKVDTAPAQPILTPPTKADIEAQQARTEQAAKAKAAQDKADAARAAKERERKDVAAASVAAADTFELGQDAMANLTGQQDVFGAIEQEAKPVVSANTIFTEDAAAKARARLKSKLGRLNSGLDPEMMIDGITLAGYHIEKGARTFAAYARAMIEDLGDGVKPYLKSWYMGVKYDPRAASFDGMDGAAAVEAADINALTAQQETQDVPSPNTSVERDSRQSATEPAVGDVVQDGRRPDATGDNQVPGQPGGSDGGRQPDGVGVPADGPVVDGIGGDLSVHSGDAKRDAAVIATGAEFSERGSGIGNDGVSAEPVSTGKVAAVAQSSSEKNRLALKQKQADSIGLKYADLDNIKSTLPMLLDGQQEDVFKAETRFSKPDGYGMLFTNGTGTGKTFTGLGIIKRMERQGKTNILVVVPDEKIGDDWIGSAKLLGLNVSKLADTKDAGKGIVLTTYANLGSNDALATRAWDLVVADEAHNLMKSSDGTVTTYLQNLRAITMHPDGAFQRYAMLNREKIDRSKVLSDEILGLERMIAADSTTDQQRAAWDAKSEALQKELGTLRGELDKALNATRADVKANQGAKRTRLAALSATPFAYEFTIDWANGYLFDYNDGQASDETESRGYNSGSNRERFFMQHFGYSMRYNKLTKPDPTKVDTGLMQRSFNTMLKKAGSLSGRMLDVKADYDRRFVLVDSAIGNQIDEALNWISDMAGDSVPGFSTLREVIGKKFDYLSRRYLLEAIKAKEAVPIVRKHMEMGRKVVVFHDYKKGGGFNPFNVSMGDAAGLDSATEDTKALAAAIDSFKQKFAALVNTPFQSLLSPIEVFRNEFPGVLLINGDEKKPDLLARYKAFQDDATGPQVALVQSAKNAGWSGHDTTGNHQRVLINLGQPTAPTLAIQQEGRIYRTGQVSNAIMRYMNTGTNWEKWAFATTIAGRASAAENLGMGELSRALKDSFIGAFEESDAYPPGHEGEGTGGKERDAAQNNQLTAWDRAKSLYWATQKKNSRTKAQEGVDYFATPEPVGMKMAEWLGSRGGERTLEPSAGHGAIARWLPETTKRTVIEPSNTLRSRLALVMNPSDDRILDVKFEALDVVNKFDGIAMNPPFGVGGKTAIEHLAKAATHLADGGRIVALIPTGPAADKRFDQWMYGEQEGKIKPLGSVVVDGKEAFIYKGDTIELQSGWAPPGVVIGWRQGAPLVKSTAPEFRNTAAVMVDSASIKSVKATGPRTEKYRAAKDMYTVGEVLLPSVTFERAGTAVSTRIVVLEKQSKAENAPNQKGTIDLSGLSDINDLFDRMENLTMPERKMTEAQKAEVEAEQKQAEASTAKTERNEAAKKQSAAVGDKVTLAGKEYDVVVYTTNAGKDIRGAWVKTKELATRFNDRTFQKKPLGWFVREKDFPRTDANQKPSLSRSDTPASPLTPAATIRAAITKAYGNLLDKLEGKGLVTIAQTEREAIEAAAQARADKTGGDAEAIAGRMMSMAGLDVKYSANGNIEGFFDKQTGKSFLVADNLTAASAPGTLMHEVGIHMAADGKLEPLFKRAGSLLKTGAQNELIQRVKARMARAGETSDEEAAAYIVTEYENDRANAPITIGKWLADLTAAVRAWLFGKGVILKADQLTVADIAAVARANARSMARGGPNGGPGGGLMFSRAADMAGNAIDKAKQTADKAMGKDFPRAASMPDLNDDQRSLLGKVGASQSPASDAIKAATDRAGLKIRQGMVDRFAALKELDEKALGQNFIADSITNSAWVLAKMSSAGSGALNAMMKSGRIEMDAQQKVIGLKGAPNGGLTASLQKLGGPAEVERFFAWMAANRAEKLMGEGRENLFTPAEIAAGKTLNTGTTEGGKVRPALYSQVHAEFQQYRDDVLAIAEQAGIINSENRAMWRDEFYVPFYRVMEDDADRGRSGGNGLSRQEAYKKLKGGKQNLNDLMENTLMNFHHLLSASLKNQAAVQAIKNAEHVGIARKVPEARRDTKTSTFVLVDGKKVFYEVDDPLVFESITTLADPGLNNTAVRVMGAFKRLFTNMTTATPQFIIANTFRDLLQASATSPTSKNIAKNLKEGIQSYRDEKTRAEMLASGGAFSFGHIYGMGADEVKASLQKTVAGAGLISSPTMIPSILRKVWDAWSDVTDLSENASRAATYAQNVDELGKLRAAFEARDVMDFSQHGAWPAVRLLVRIVPFLNARLQGLDKLYRSGLKPSILTAMGKGTDTDKQAAARFAMVTGALTLATMALYMLNADDDEYKKLEEWQKDTYWFIRIGENAFFLPKPFEVGAIATVAERTLQQAMDDKATGKLFRERMWEMLMQTFAFNPTPQMFQPLVDVYSNKDAFTGRDIETAGMERMSAGLRSRDTTTAPATALSAVSRVFGDESAIAVSPVQADHLIKGYLGGVGATAAGWIDTMYRAATGQSSPDKAWSEYQPIRRFYRDLDVPVANTRYTTLFYDGLKEANRVYADVMELQKLGRTEEAQALATEKRSVLQMRIALNAQQRRLTEINNRMKEVRRSDKDGEWKRRELDLLTTQKALITERLGKRIEDARAQ